MGIKMEDLVLGFLFISALWDIKTRKLPAFWLYGGMVCMGGYMLEQVMMGKRDGMELFFALLPGVLCLLWARMTKTMGEGDAWLIMGMGLCFSCKCVLAILIIAFFLAALAAVVVLIVKKNIKNRKMAFVPFLFCSVWIMRIWGI